MENKSTTPFVIFIIALVITVAVFSIAAFYPMLGWDRKNLIYLGFSQSLVAIITPIGVFSAYKAKNNNSSKSKNKVSLWGNVVLFIFTISIMIYALI